MGDSTTSTPEDSGWLFDEYDGPRFWSFVNFRGGMPYLEDRLARVTESDGECWVWTGAARNGQYGVMAVNYRLREAHRWSYEAAFGPVDDDLVIDHMCHNSLCVRPDHLQAVTQKENCENRSGPQSNSSTGVRGVFWHKASRKWTVQVKHHKVNHYGGLFESLSEAEAAAIALRNRLFTNNLLDRDSAIR